jgi:hypothetical protein
MSDPKDKGYRIIRLVNGERLIAKISGSTKQKMTLNRPMTVRGMTTGGGMPGLSREYLVLQDWLEHSNDINIKVPTNQVLTISTPDEFISDAYEAQKDFMDNDPSPNQTIGNLPDDMTLKDLFAGQLPRLLEGEELLGEELQDFLNDLVNSIVQKAGSNLEDDEWFEDDRDTERDEWGNDLNDWSPYPDDYS